MKKPIVFWGASGHAKVLRDFIGELGYELVATVDNRSATIAPFPDVPLLIGEAAFRDWIRAKVGVSCLVAVGGHRGWDRLNLLELMKFHGAVPATVVHPRASVAGTAQLGSGTQVLAQAVVSAEAKIGDACIINHSAVVDHESEIGDGVHVAPGATVTGCVSVGMHTFVGAGAVILPRLKIGKAVLIGAGAVVTKDLPDGVVAYGNPARIVRPNRP